MPLHNEDNFKNNFTFMVVESEVQNEKFYFVCHHQFNVFSFHVLMKCNDEKEASKFIFNIAIEDGSRVCTYIQIVYFSLISLLKVTCIFRINIIKESFGDVKAQFYLGEWLRTKF